MNQIKRVCSPNLFRSNGANRREPISTGKATGGLRLATVQAKARGRSRPGTRGGEPVYQPDEQEQAKWELLGNTVKAQPFGGGEGQDLFEVKIEVDKEGHRFLQPAGG